MHKKRKGIWGLIPSKNTVLGSFLRERIEDYKEPRQAGSDPHERIGFSLPKFASAQLLGATRFTQKDVSENLGFSYGSLRQWLQDKFFQDALEDASRLFAQRVAGHMRDRLEKGEKPDEPDFALVDVSLYNRRVVERIPVAFFKKYPTLIDLLAFDPESIIEFADAVFGKYHPGIVAVWKKNYAKAVVSRFGQEYRNELLFSKTEKIPVDRGALGQVLGILEEHLSDWKE